MRILVALAAAAMCAGCGVAAETVSADVVYVVESPGDCDTGNPCSVDVDCTPGGVDDLPPFCAGLTGCQHCPRTTPIEQEADCFPSVDGARVGVCRFGVCR